MGVSFGTERRAAVRNLLKLAVTVVCLCGAMSLSVAEEKKEVVPEWRLAVYEFCRANLQHTAWGVTHCERNFTLALALAKEEELTIDEDVLFAAAFLHDLGALEPYAREEVDHAERSADLAGPILERSGFPMEKLAGVKEAIRGHMFYAKVGDTPEAVVLHDADTLDFLGNIGIARILSMTTRHSWAPDLKGAVATLEKFQRELPDKLITKAARKVGEKRVEEMKKFIESLEKQANERRSL
jgi:uncharacterized protein